VIGVVLAPRDYYYAPGKKSRSVGATLRLAARMKVDTGVDCKLAVWDAGTREIVQLDQ